MPRPRQRILSRGIIAEAALNLAERERDFTIPAMARELGVHPSSLYHHVKGGKNEIIHLMRATLYERIDLTEFARQSRPWRDRFAEWIEAYRASMALVPEALPPLVREPVDDDLTLKLYEAAFNLLAEAGINEHEQVDVVTLIDIVVLGSALDSMAPVPLWQPGDSHVPTLSRAAHHGDDAGRSLRGMQLAITAISDYILKLGSPNSGEDRTAVR